MGTYIMFTLLMIELLFAVYCIVTKSYQKKIKRWIRISEFIIFLILIIASIIIWSFRWYLLTGLLVVWLIMSIISLVRKKEEKKVFQIWKMTLSFLVRSIIIIICAVPVLVFPQYKNPAMTGKYEISTVTYTYTDENREETFNTEGEKRQLNIEFWYPKTMEGTYPLIVFSHGAFGIKASNTSTFEELASNGYVVCSIDHPYHAMYTENASGKITTIDSSFMKEVLDVNNDVYDDKATYELTHKWLKLRTDDINFVIDTIKKNVNDKSSDSVYQLMDTSKIGLIGHSLGGAASVQLGRDRNDIKSVINLDADLIGEVTGFENGKNIVNDKIYPLPILSIYSDDMKKGFESITDPSIIIPQRRISATAHDAFEVYFSGTNHLSLTDLPLFSPFLVKQICNTTDKMTGNSQADKYYVIDTMNHLILDFYNCYLKGEGTFTAKGTY